MALVYFDASALVKLCVPEAGSALASRLWNRADVVVTSRLADVEVRAALAAPAGRPGAVGGSRAVRARGPRLDVPTGHRVDRALTCRRDQDAVAHELGDEVGGRDAGQPGDRDAALGDDDLLPLPGPLDP